MKKTLKLVLWLFVWISLHMVVFAETEPKNDFQYGKPVANFSLAVKIKVEKHKLGRIICAIVRVKNISDATQMIVQITPFYQYFFEVMDASGKKVPKLLYQQKIDRQGKNGGSAPIFTPVKPGEYLEYKFDLSRCFDFSLRGKYYIKCNRDLMLHTQENKKLYYKKIYSPNIEFYIE